MATKRKEQQKTEQEVKECPACGMPKEEWSEPAGYTRGEETYCCRGCADGTGCTCGE